MPFDDLRDFLSFLESKTEIAKVTREIDNSKYEISAILDRLPKLGGKAVIFENVKGYDFPVVANTLGTMRRISLALDISEQQLSEEWRRRLLSKWPKTKQVSDGRCKERLFKQEDVNLLRLPVFKWNPLDAAPYITLGVIISKDPETGERNAGIYRLMVQGKTQLGINMIPGKGVSLHYGKAEAKRKPLEVAIAIGLEPAILLAAATNLKQGQDELAFAGALRKEALTVTSCQTVDIEVPAQSEIVIEGIIPPKIRETEGPFGESTGFYGKAEAQPVIQVKAISMRENPLYQTTYTGKFPKEEHFISSATGYCHNILTKNLFFSKKELWRAYSTVRARLKFELTAQHLRLPIKVVAEVEQQWSSYGFD